MMKVLCERRLVELSCFKALRLCLSSLEPIIPCLLSAA
jgi:hypothetical protein